jgi:ribonuclease Z
MKLTLLGTGGPLPDPTRHGSAAVLQIGDARLLVDAGRGVVLQLARAGIPVDTVGPVLVTHHHYDHIGDLADVILTGWLQGRRRPLRILGPPGTEAIVTALVERVYHRDIAFRSKGEHAVEWAPVDTADVTTGLVLDGGDWRVLAEPVIHGHGLGYSPDFTRRWVCLGYRVEAEGKAVAFSGDCVRCDGLERLARGVDLLGPVLLHGAKRADLAVLYAPGSRDHRMRGHRRRHRPAGRREEARADPLSDRRPGRRSRRSWPTSRATTTGRSSWDSDLMELTI